MQINPVNTPTLTFTDLIAKMSKKSLQGKFYIKTKPSKARSTSPILMATMDAKVAKEVQNNQPYTIKSVTPERPNLTRNLG